MPYDPYAAARRVRGLPGRLSNLAEHLRLVSSQVRASVSEAIGDTLAFSVRDTLNRLWSGQRLLEAPARSIPQHERNGWPDERDHDPWADEPSAWDDRREPVRVHPERPQSLPRSGALALAMQMAGWWMYRRGTLFGALGLGLVVGSVALIGGRVARTGLGLIESASEIFAVHNSLTTGALALGEA